MQKLEMINTSGMKVYEKNLNKLKQLQKNDKKINAISTVTEKKKIFWFFERKATVYGEDLNNVINSANENLNIINNKITNSLSQLVEVYNVLDVLNREYISGIIASYNKAAEATNIAIENQDELNRNFEQLKHLVGDYVEFKNLVSNEIAKLSGKDWEENAKQYNNLIQDAEKRILSFDEFEKRFKNVEYLINSRIQSIEKLQTSIKIIENAFHSFEKSVEFKVLLHESKIDDNNAQISILRNKLNETNSKLDRTNVELTSTKNKFDGKIYELETDVMSKYLEIHERIDYLKANLENEITNLKNTTKKLTDWFYNQLVKTNNKLKKFEKLTYILFGCTGFLILSLFILTFLLIFHVL